MELIKPSNIQFFLATKFGIETVKHIGLIGSDHQDSGVFMTTRRGTPSKMIDISKTRPHPTSGVCLKMGVYHRIAPATT